MGARQTAETAGAVSRPLAEYVSPEMTSAQIRHYETRRNPEGLFRSAWNYTEFGLNQYFNYDASIRDYYFEHAQNLIGTVLTHSKAKQDTILGGLVLSSYIPIFQKRSHDQPLTSEDCHAVYESLGRAMQYLQPLDVDQPPQWRMAETAVLSLSARTLQPDNLLHPSSPREESSSDASFNHDSYFLPEKAKIPLQQKLLVTDKEYDEWITILTLQPLVVRSMRKAGTYESMNLADQINYLLSLIITETSGHRLTKSQNIFLNTMSAAVVSHRWKRDKNSKTAA